MRTSSKMDHYTVYYSRFKCIIVTIFIINILLLWRNCFIVLSILIVEKVAVLCRFLDIGAVTKNHLLKYSLAHAFCCFLASVEDVNPAVATRARLLLDTIKRPALQVNTSHSPSAHSNSLSFSWRHKTRKKKYMNGPHHQEFILVLYLCNILYSCTYWRCAMQGLCLCLDFQFDTVVRDRPVILSKLLLLHVLKKDVPALSWEFFVNRFETLSLEAQLHLDCNKEFPFPTSMIKPKSPNLRFTCGSHITVHLYSKFLITCLLTAITAVRTNVANLSDAAMWKIRRARFARNQQKSVRSLRDSVKGGPPESKRAFSLPESLSNRQCE